MNNGNTIVLALESSLQMPREFCCSPKFETELSEQSEFSTSTSKSIPIATSKSDALQKSRGIASDKELSDAIELLNEFIDLYFSEPNKSKFALLDIKAECESFFNELNCITPDKEQVDMLKLQIAHYQQFCIKEMTRQDPFEETLDTLLSYVYGFSSEDKLIIDAVEKINRSTDLLRVSKNELKSLFQEVEVLLDSILRQLSHIEMSENNIEDAGFIN